MNTSSENTEPKAVCIRRGVWQISPYVATHVPHPSRLTSAWVIWDGVKPVAVVGSMPEVREWITIAKAGDAR